MPLTSDQINHIPPEPVFTWMAAGLPTKNCRVVPLVEGMKWKVQSFPGISSWYYAIRITVGRTSVNAYYVLISDTECVLITQAMASMLGRITPIHNEWIKFNGENFVHATAEVWEVVLERIPNLEIDSIGMPPGRVLPSVIKETEEFETEELAFLMYKALAYPELLPDIKNITVFRDGKKIRGIECQQ
jgi:hypothetical protein